MLFNPTNIFRTLCVNLMVFGALGVLVELVFGHWFSPLDPPLYCQSALYHHDFCPGVVTRSALDPLDGGAVIETVTNRSRLRVADASLAGSETDTASYDVINIGDSFMESHQVAYGQTLSRVMEKHGGRKVLQVGISSWAPAVYLNWLQNNPLKKGVEVNLFLMMNDVTERDPYSNMAYHRLGRQTPEGLRFDFSYRLAIKEFVRYRSFFYYTAWKIYDGWVNQPASSNSLSAVGGGKWLDGDFSAPQRDCSRLASLADKTEPMAYDYLVFAFDSACWPPGVREHVESAVSDLRKIKAAVEASHGKLRVLVVPSGWAFPGENIAGKETNHYHLKENTLITTLPLASYLRGEVGAPVIALEPVIRDMKRASSPGEKWFFNLDGHWTPYAHARLGEWLARLE